MLPEENVLFKGIERDDCRRMINCFNADIKKFKSGNRIMDYSDNPDKLGIILNGTAVMIRYDINGVRSIMESLVEQSVFGVYFTFTASQRSGIEIIAETECEVMFVRRSEITKRCENACHCHTRVVENLLDLMSEKAISLNERIEVLSQRSIEDKLIQFSNILSIETTSLESKLELNVTFF